MARNREVYVPLSDTSVSLNCEGVSRRGLLQRGALSLGGLLLGNRLLSAAPNPTSASASAGREAKAKAVIQIWLSGGPPHTDTFDPKPEAGSDYTGPLSGYLETNVKGIRIAPLLTELAKVADKYSIIRSMTHARMATNGPPTWCDRRMPGAGYYPAVGRGHCLHGFSRYSF